MTRITAKVNLTDQQASKLVRYVKKGKDVSIKLTNANLTGSDRVIVNKTMMKKIETARKNGKGLVIQLDADENHFWCEDVQGSGMFDEDDNVDVANDLVEAAALTNPYTAAAMNLGGREIVGKHVKNVVGKTTKFANKIAEDVLGEEMSDAVGAAASTVGDVKELADDVKDIISDPRKALQTVIKDPRKVLGAAKDKVVKVGKKVGKTVKNVGKAIGKTAKKARKAFKSIFGFGANSLEGAGLDVLIGSGVSEDEIVDMFNNNGAFTKVLRALGGMALNGNGADFPGGERNALPPKILGTGRKGRGADFSGGERNGNAVEVGTPADLSSKKKIRS